MDICFGLQENRCSQKLVDVYTKTLHVLLSRFIVYSIDLHAQNPVETFDTSEILDVDHKSSVEHYLMA